MALYIMVKFYMINTLYSHFLVKYCFKNVCIWGRYGVKGEYCRHREHPKQKHRPIFDQHDWRQGEWLGLAGVIGLQGRCCLVSSNPTKGHLRKSQRQILRFLHKCLGPGVPNGNSSFLTPRFLSLG